MIPRQYQLDAFNAVKVFMEYREGNPLVVMPTASGKSIIVAMLCEWLASFDLRVMVVTHSMELIEQNAQKISTLAPTLDVGVYSAGLGLRQLGRQTTVAGVQSVWRKVDDLGEIDVVLIDEAHAINDDEDTMYGQLIAGLLAVNPKLRCIGLTATPFRLSSGPLVGEGRLFNAIGHEVSLRKLVDDGWLAPLRSKRVAECDTRGLKIVAGEFTATGVASLMEPTTEAAVAEILARTADRKTVLIFAAGVAHAEQVCQLIPGAELITGETDTERRADIIARARSGELKFVVNIRCLTTGTDCPSIDCIAVLFPTASPGLWLQIVGRGMRLSPGKTFCTILDFGSNIERFGPIYDIQPPKPKGAKGTGVAPVKFCPDCKEAVATAIRFCPDCGHEFPAPEVKTESKSSNLDITGDEAEELPVFEVRYRKHFKKGGTPDDPPTLRVEYITKQGMVSSWMKNAVISEWVCVEHPPGFAKNKAAMWWKLRSNDPMPDSVDRAIDMAEGGGLAVPSKIWVVPEGKYTRISRVELGPKPEAAALCESCRGAGCDECKFEFEDVTPTEFSVEECPF